MLMTGAGTLVAAYCAFKIFQRRERKSEVIISGKNYARDNTSAMTATKNRGGQANGDKEEQEFNLTEDK